ncbi:MAG: tRNA (adenosine(37)-N6)-dimethylallyltransferase MiaA [Lentisphaeria bacterium]|nr:tRNA (adenosine(37)-N6)-dimethylallyltransferase MiaA [Lentisphaeria bacterium]
MFATNPDARRFPVVMGPTASGKTALALEIAGRADGEIVSADSMQIYRGLDIGTAKPSPEERRSIRHHLIDVADITEKYDVFRFISEAERCIGEIRSAGKLPVVAGGTGLYLRALLYGLDPMPADSALRSELDRKYDNDEHYAELCALMAAEDPEDWQRFGSNRRKLLRAREVFLLSGQPMARLQERWKRTPPRSDAVSFVLVWDNEELKRRIAQRCREMLKNGWIEEAEHFLQDGLHQSPTAWQVLGYRQIAEFLAGRLSRRELPERIATATWQFARRQNTWFRTQHPEAVRLVMPDPDAANRILRICIGGEPG